MFSNAISVDETKPVVTVKPDFEFLHESEIIAHFFIVWTIWILMQRQEPTLFRGSCISLNEIVAHGTEKMGVQ